VELLERQNYSVWWDRSLSTGTAFDKEIELELDNAQCVLVMWSYASVMSDWVRAEASDALGRSILVPVFIDDVKPPLIFRNIQTISLVGWPSSRSADAVNSIFSAIQLLLSGEAPDIKDEVTESALAAENSIAVLPFRSLSPDPKDEFLAEGLAEEIRNVLSQIPDLNVASRTSSFQFKDGQGGDSRAIGAQLNVRFLLEGSVRKAGNNLRISVQLIQALDGYTQWSQKYDKTIEDIFTVEDEIAARVASALKSTLWETTLEHRARNRTDNIDAYRSYLLAMHFDRQMHQGGTEELVLVRKHAERAVEIDPAFVPAWVLLAMVYLNRMGFRLSKEEAHPLARNALERAIQLDPDNPGVLLQLAELFRGEHRKVEALELFKKARSLDRDTPQCDYATLLLTMGKVDEALRELELCNANDPENVSHAFYYAAALYGAGQMSDAIDQFKKSLVIVGDGFLSDAIRAAFAGALVQAGDIEAGREVLQPCLLHNPKRVDLERGMIACTQAMIGDQKSAESMAKRLELVAAKEHQDPQALFWVYYGLEQDDKTFYWMEKVVEEDSFPSIYFLKTWPFFDRLRQDSRCEALLIKAGITST